MNGFVLFSLLAVLAAAIISEPIVRPFLDRSLDSLEAKSHRIRGGG